MDMKQVLLSDLEWDFSDEDMVELKVGNTILVLTRDELNDFIESWDENWEQIYLNIVRIFRYNKKMVMAGILGVVIVACVYIGIYLYETNKD